MQDPSIEVKIELGEEGEEIIEEWGRIAKQLVKGSDASEELLRIAKEFTICEGSVEKTEKLMKQINLISDEMEQSRGRILKSLTLTKQLHDQVEDLNVSLNIPAVAALANVPEDHSIYKTV